MFEEEPTGPITVAYVPTPVLKSSTTAAGIDDAAVTTFGTGGFPSSSTTALRANPGLEVPTAQQDLTGTAAPISPRTSPTTRSHAAEADSSEPKRAKVEDHKKQRIDRLVAEQESVIRAVRFGDESYYTLDSYEAELQEEDSSADDEWKDEEELCFAGVAEQLVVERPGPFTAATAS